MAGGRIIFKIVTHLIPDFVLRFFLKWLYLLTTTKLTLSNGVRLGRNITFGSYNRIYSDTKVSNCKIGDFTYIANDSCISNTDIGKFCSIGPGVRTGMGIHPTKFVSTHPIFYSTMAQSGVVAVPKNYFIESHRTYIGNDVWLGANVVIHDGIKIGNGAIIASGSVVNKDVAPYSIVGGIPASLIKYRFNEETITQLMDLSWWDDISLDDVCKYYKKFHNVESFLEKKDD